MLVDNVRLFTYDMSELHRYMGKPIGLFDKCQSKLWMLLAIYCLVFLGFAGWHAYERIG